MTKLVQVSCDLCGDELGVLVCDGNDGKPYTLSVKRGRGRFRAALADKEIKAVKCPACNKRYLRIHDWMRPVAGGGGGVEVADGGGGG